MKDKKQRLRSKAGIIWNPKTGKIKFYDSKGSLIINVKNGISDYKNVIKIKKWIRNKV